MMSTPNHYRRTAALVCGVAIALSAGSCRKRGGEEVAGPPPVVAAELGSNRTAGLPGGVYRSQAQSPVSWQPWNVFYLRCRLMGPFAACGTQSSSAIPRGTHLKQRLPWKKCCAALALAGWQLITKTCRLSSTAPRAKTASVPASVFRTVGSNGGLIHSANGSGGCTS